MADSLNSLLLNSKKALDKLSTFSKVKIVLGNESCDLDSTVSSLVYSLFLSQYQSYNTIVIPIVNVRECDFPIKTEVNYFCKDCGIETKHFIFRDQINLDKLKEAGLLELILVDHHTLIPEEEPLRNAVVEVIDHRPKDPASHWPEETKVCIETVGSCSTLIARKLLTTNPSLLTPNIAKLLYGTILSDTACLSNTAGIAQPLDFEITDKLQQICAGSLSAEKIFQNINSTKADISGLTTRQVLIKDLKIVSSIPIFGLPVLVQTFLILPDAPASVTQFCEEQSFKFAILMGLSVSSAHIERDLAIYCHSQDKENLSLKLVSSLLDNNFDLIEVALPGLSSHFKVYRQNNIKYSRKKILSIVRDFGQSNIV